ncbi:MAG: ribokinase [Alphaproteobacteria bacterium]|nr:ribokinase [Alphaproteobacteria bacterium]
MAAMIVVFGSLNVDIILAVPAFPRPGETTLTQTYDIAPGGKGANQALAAARALGEPGRVAMAGMIGDDAWGRTATALLTQAGVDLAHVGVSAQPTGCATIWVDGHGQNEIVVASGANSAATAAQVPDPLLGPDTILVLQMEVDPKENWALVKRARAKGAKILLNVAPALPVPADHLKTVDILVVNEIEAVIIAAAAGLAQPIAGASHDGAAHDRTIRAEAHLPTARALARRHDLACIVTAGPDGAIAATPDEGWLVAALPVEPVDTTGAGDAFVGNLAAALEGGLDLAEAMRQASVAAALACLKKGCQPAYATGRDIASRLDELPPARRLF